QAKRDFRNEPERPHAPCRRLAHHPPATKLPEDNKNNNLFWGAAGPRQSIGKQRVAHQIENRRRGQIVVFCCVPGAWAILDYIAGSDSPTVEFRQNDRRGIARSRGLSYP